MQHAGLTLGDHVFLGDHVVIFQSSPSQVTLGNRVHLYRDVMIETGEGGCVVVGDDTRIQPGCRIIAYKGNVRIGKEVQIAPACAFYPYNHGTTQGEPIHAQPLLTKGGIEIGDGAWLGVGTIVLDGVIIGPGAVVGAGSVVTRDIPGDAIAVGSPARVIGKRSPEAAGQRRLEWNHA